MAGQARPEGLVRAQGLALEGPKTGEFVRAVTRPDDPELLTRHEVLNGAARRPDHQLLDAGVHADAAARAAGLRSHTAVAGRTTLTRSSSSSSTRRTSTAAPLVPRWRCCCGACALGWASRPSGCRSSPPAPASTTPEYARDFAAQLTGKDADDFRTVTSQWALRDGRRHGYSGRRRVARARAAGGFLRRRDGRRARRGGRRSADRPGRQRPGPPHRRAAARGARTTTRR